MTILVTLLGLAVLLLGVLVAGLLRSHADVLRALHDLGAGEEALDGTGAVAPLARHPAAGSAGATSAHDLLGRSPDDAMVAITVDGVAHRTLLAFLTSGCTTCHGFWDAFSAPALALPAAADRLVIVTRSPANESPASIAKLAPAHTPVVMTEQAWEDYDVRMAPYFVLVDGPSGSVVGEGAAVTWQQVAGLLGRATADGVAAGGPDNAVRIEAELQAAGIEPGHPSLYPDSTPVEHEHD